MKIVWIIRTWFYRTWLYSRYMKIESWWNDTACQHMPKIQRKFPQPPNQNCPRCGKPINKIVAINTGDGWVFEWACENVGECEEADIIVGWFPFVFNWATNDDLQRIGIEVL